MKKSQTSQIFIYILSIILVSLILLYGYKSINHFMTRANEVAYIKFETDLKSIVEIMGPDHGSVKRQEFSTDYKTICFVDSDEIGGPGIVGIHPVINNFIISGVNNNVFLITPDESVEKSFDVGRIKVDSKFLCLDSVKGRIRLEFEGMGDRTKISQWPFQ